MTARAEIPTAHRLPPPQLWWLNGLVMKTASFLIILAAVAWAHSPALNRFFVADQISYFAELEGNRSLAKGLSLWDYNVSRRFAKGDQVLFRPLLFAVLAVENTLFGTDPYGWNLVNLLLHAVTACMLCELIWHIHPGLLATLLSLFFAVSHCLIELVIWNHLSGYLFAALLILCALYCVVRCTEQLDLHRQNCWACMFAIMGLMAAMTYELGVAMAFVGAAAIWLFVPRVDGYRNRFAIGVSTIPACGYLLGYAIHLANVSRLTWRQQEGPPRSLLSITFQCCRCCGIWLLEAIDPWRSTLIPASPFDRFMRLPAAGDALFSNFTTVALVIGCATLLILNGFTVRSLLQRRCYSMCAMALLVFYLLITNIGRDNAERITYYTYFFLLLLMLLIPAALDTSTGRAWARPAAAAFLISLSLANATVSRQTSLEVHQQHVPINAYFDKLRAVIDTHCSDPEFTFVADGVPNTLDPPRFLIHGFPDNPTAVEVRRVSGLIFALFYRPQPKYLLYLTRDGVVPDLVDPKAYKDAAACRAGYPWSPSDEETDFGQ